MSPISFGRSYAWDLGIGDVTDIGDVTGIGDVGVIGRQGLPVSVRARVSHGRQLEFGIETKPRAVASERAVNTST